MIARHLFVLSFAAALLVGFGCSNSAGGGGSTGPALACIDGGAAPADAVAMSCAGPTASTTEQVDVVIGGTASGTTTLRGINFDVTYDSAKLTFTPEASYTSPLFPNALVGVSLFDGAQGRVVVSIQQPGGLPDVVIPAGQNVTLSLSLARVSGTTFASTPITFENAEATGASTTINFGGTVSLSYQ